MSGNKTRLYTGVLALALSLVFAAGSLRNAAASGKKRGTQAHDQSRTSSSTRMTEPTAPQPDISSLSSQKICWGQGRNFDQRNRPRDAVTSQEKYGGLGGVFIDLSESGRKKIYLTFDEGYENGYTAPILDTLKEKNVRAVFFITGDYARREGELVQRMIDEGQIVGNHTWRHYSMPEKSEDVCREEIRLLHDYVRDNFGCEMTLLRPPKGEFSEKTLALASQMGYRTCLWSFAYKDWDANAPGDPAQSLRKLTDRLHDGAVYLLHAVSPTNAAILGEFIDQARAQGYEFAVL